MAEKKDIDLYQEVAELKKEVAELKKTIQAHPKAIGFDFDEYKVQVNHEDLQKLDDFKKKMKWYWFLPVVGLFVFGIQQQINIESLDRGLVRSELTKSNVRYLIPSIFIGMISFAINLAPLLDIYVIRPYTKAKVLKKIEEANIKNKLKG
ncbi:MAG: hypothetical protein ACRCVI_02605 [Mycoplasmoidaceae bacterium]